MNRILLTAMLIWVLPNHSIAQDVGLFGLTDPKKGKALYAQALEIIEDSDQDDDLFGGIENQYDPNDSSSDEYNKESEFSVLHEAYRADPDATLELIRLIMEAGRVR